MIDISALRALVAVEQHGSVVAAADVMGFSLRQFRSKSRNLRSRPASLCWNAAAVVCSLQSVAWLLQVMAGGSWVSSRNCKPPCSPILQSLPDS